MRRFLLLSCLAAGGAYADAGEADGAQARGVDERAFAPKGYAAADGAAGAPATSTTATPAPATPAVSTSVKPAVVDEKKVDKKEDKFPLGMGISLSTQASNAWLAPTSGPVDIPVNGGTDSFTVPGSPGMQQANLSQSLSLAPSARLPKLFDGMPQMSLGGGMSFSVNNWFSASGNGGVYDRQIRMSDLSVRLSAGELYKEEVTGIKVGASIGASVPLSITSRQSNLATGLSLSLPFSWSGPDWGDWGQIGVNYSTSGRVSLYTSDAPTIPCEAGIGVAGIISNPLENGDIPLTYAREADIAPNGECRLRGRQGIASLNNGLSASWTLGNHSLSASVGWAVGFLRPISNRPDLASENATGQNFNETSNGNLSYSYSVPDLPVSISAGIGSSQAVFIYDEGSKQFVPRFPFYDFLTPGNGLSGAFVDLSVKL